MSSFAIVPVETMQPAAAAEFIKANEDRLPKTFTLYVSYAQLFFGGGRSAAESKIMDAIMRILAWNFTISVSKEDEHGRIKMVCEAYGRPGERIASSHTQQIDRI